MTIELKISVNHATDLAAEVQMLAEIFGVGGTAPAKNVAGETSKPSESTASAPSQPAASTSTAAPADGGKTDERKALTRKEQDVAVEQMKAAGKKDDRFDMLTKGRQNEVEEALAKASVPVAKSDDVDLDDMFSDDEPAVIVTREKVSELMGKIGKDEDGNPIQSRLLEIRKILVDLIPDGKEIQVKNLPEDKLAEAYEKISKIGG